MDAGKRARGSYISEMTPSMQSLLFAPFDFQDLSVTPLWQRYLTHRHRDDFEALVKHYMPLCSIMATRLKRLRPWLFMEDFADYVSDGYLTLMRVIGSVDAVDVATYPGLLCCAIQRSIHRYRDMRTQFGEQRNQGHRFTARIRSRLVRRLGRVPTQEEVGSEIARVIHNPVIDKGLSPKLYRFSEMESEGGGTRTYHDARASDPFEEVARAELTERVMKKLAPRDRKILRLILRGESYQAIGDRFGISRERIRQVLNMILWQARAHAGVFSPHPGSRSRRAGGNLRQGEDSAFAPARRPKLLVAS
jgi:RNA polymerase sigma factor (sigma-70 family)